MTAKSHPTPKLSLADQVLSSRISLPSDPCISYVRFVPDPSSYQKPHQSLEFARRKVLASNVSAHLLESILSSVYIDLDPFMYVFLISAQETTADAASTLSALSFDGLVANDTSSFVLKGLYPCSPSCSALLEPCPTCLDHPSPDTPTAPSLLLPRKPLRLVFSHFLEAVRIRLLDDIVQASLRKSPMRASRPVKRLKGGFLLGSNASANEWGSSWEYRALSRPLLFCQFQIHLTNKPQGSEQSLVIHPHLLPTHFIPLGYLLPLPAGAPITLLPHGTPAFFLTHYSGPTSALKKQFQESLQGLGVSGWESTSSLSSTGFVRNGSATKPEFIIAWINVENKHGEDKGITLIYPTALCLSFSYTGATGALSRLPLDYIPELPAPLQSSPHVSTTISVSELHGKTTASGPQTLAIPGSPPLPMSTFIHATRSQPDPRPVLPSSPTSESVRALRALTLSKSKDIRQVATEVAGYVDAIARERERERERLKRERENGVLNSPKLSRTAAPTPAAPTPSTTVAADTPTPAPPLTSQTVTGLIQSQPQHSTPTQNFYPSPPQTNAPIIPSQTGQPLSIETTVTPSDPSATAAMAISSTSTVASVPNTTPVPVPTPIQTTQATFDPFGSSDAVWAMQSQPYLGMNVDMDMDFDIGMGMDMGFGMNSSSRSGAYTSSTGAGVDFDDAAFTDDDYSFFDAPSVPARGLPLPPPSLPLNRPSTASITMQPNGVGPGLTPSVAPTPPGVESSIFAENINLSAPQLTSVNQLHNLHSSPWVPGTLGEGFTPRYMTETDSSAALPDLLPPSPGPTPRSNSAPPTPTVYLESEPAIQRPSTGFNSFDPIPFSAYHRALDGKYAVGKFSLSSPPDEEDRTEPLNLTWQQHGKTSFRSKLLGAGISSAPGPSSSGWGLKYIAATDPRIGVVRKLIGVKRKINFEHGGREKSVLVLSGTPSMPPSWIREHEDWDKNTVSEVEHLPTVNTRHGQEDNKSDAESDYDMDDTQEETPVLSRPSTPLPVYLPLGPTLIHAQFHHSELLPLSTPLRPPGAAVAPTNMTTSSLIASVPTPVSPAAMLGATSEKSKSLEAAAFTVATEVVENPPWAEAWRASILAGSKQPMEVWLADVHVIMHLLKTVPGLDGPLDLNTLFCPAHEATPAAKSEPDHSSKGPLQLLEAPMFSIGKGDAIIQVLPTALRFWEKLGLGPRGGRKNGTTFVLFEDEGEPRQQQVELWLSTVAATYESKHLGIMVPGKSPSCPKDGICPLRFDSTFRKSLAALVASLPASDSGLIFFIVTPMRTMTLASPVLRQVFSAVKKAIKTYSEAQIHFQFIPEQLINGNLNNPAASFSDLEVLCVSIYNRILLPVDRVMSRRFSDDGERVRKYFQEPALTLARPMYSKVSFVGAPHAALDVLDRNTFLHVGYQVSPCGKWILAACVDQRGEAHDLAVWLTQTPGEGDSEEDPEDLFLVKKIWAFGMQFARRANVEWRAVFSRLGVMGERELNAWADWIEVNQSNLHASSISVLSVDFETPWTFCSQRVQPKLSPSKPYNPNRSSSALKNHPQNIFTDVSNTVYTLSPHNTLPQSHPPSLADLGLTLSLIPEPPYHPSTPASPTPQREHQLPPPVLPHPLSLIPPSSATLVCLPAAPSSTPATMLHICILHTVRPPSATNQEDIPSLHDAITRNFHELAVLTSVRWRLGVSPVLPFHLAAVEAMRIALDRDQHGLDPTDSGT